MKIDSLQFATIEQLAPLLAARKLSPVELTRMFIERINRLHPSLHAFITVTSERAMADARRAENEILKGRSRGPLHGIPIVLKDNVWTRGIRTTAGSEILRDFAPAKDATVFRRLQRAGVVLLGKTNMHEFAYGITSENPHYGSVQNPWRAGRISGGSSGGSAACIAAGLCVASVGSDTGGSIRVPSSLCGTVGLKPSFGRISVHGIIPLAPSFDHAGPMTRSVGDAALLLSVLAGFDPLDPISAARPSEDFFALARGRTKRFRLGLPKQHYWEHLDREVRKATEDAVASMIKRGARVEEISLPGVPEAVNAANLVALVEATRGHQKAGYFPGQAAQYGADVRDRLEQGLSVRALDYLRACDIVAQSRADYHAALRSVDAIVAPTTPITAPAIGSVMIRTGDLEESMRNALVRLNRPGNFTGLPSISVPCGFSREGLPIGLQFIGRPFGEGALLNLARSYERSHEWRFRHPAGY